MVQSDVFSNHNHSQENFINQPIHSYAVTISPCSENSSSPATAMNNHYYCTLLYVFIIINKCFCSFDCYRGIGDDQCYDDGLSNSDHCPTSSNFDETNPEFVWLQPLPTTVHEIQFLLFLTILISLLLKKTPGNKSFNVIAIS
jgi:hypothetical protein